MSRTAAILLAAGSGRRMDGAVQDKILAPLGGRPVFAHSAAAFITSGVADFYVVVYRDRRQMLELSAYAPTPSALVRGGRERADSVANALAALPDDIAYVFIHDCARPLVRAEQLVALHKNVRRTGAVVLAHRVTDTIKQCSETRPASRRLGGGWRRFGRSTSVLRYKLRTLDRSLLWAMETPQVFKRSLVVRGYETAAARRLTPTDDAAAVELLGHRIALLENPHPNPKLTKPGDLDHLQFLLDRT